MTWTEAKSNCTLLGPSVRGALQSAQISSQGVQDKAWIGAYRGHTPWLSVRGRTCMLQKIVRQMRLYVIRHLLFGPQIRLKVGVFEDLVVWRNSQIVWTCVFVWYCVSENLNWSTTDHCQWLPKYKYSIFYLFDLSANCPYVIWKSLITCHQLVWWRRYWLRTMM